MGIFDIPFSGPMAIAKLAESFVDNNIRDNVSEPAIGSVVYCDLLAGSAEHSGIYVGNNQIVHLNGDGIVEVVSPKEFMDRLGGWNTAISIYVSCNNGTPVGSRKAAKLAKKIAGNTRRYNLVSDNCHQFTAGCLIGNFENGYNFFSLLKHAVSEVMDGDEWRVWDF